MLRRWIVSSFVVLLVGLCDRVYAAEQPCGDCAPAQDAQAFKASLLLALKNRSYIADFAAMAQAQGRPDAKLLHKTLAGDVIVVPVEDRPRISRFLAVGEGKRFGVSDKDIFDVAFGNLKKRAASVKILVFDKVRALDFYPDYNASLLLLENVWASVPDLPDQLVVALPARDILAFADGADAAAVVRLRGISNMPSKGFPVSRLLLKRVAGRWSVLD